VKNRPQLGTFMAVAASAALCAVSLQAATVAPVTDIRLAADASTSGGLQAKVRGAAEMDGIVYFAGTDPANGEELWRTDGTPEGTWLVTDIAPGESGSFPYPLAVGTPCTSRPVSRRARTDGPLPPTTRIKALRRRCPSAS
jgi:ELWxxDGT repeat protein